MDARQTAIYHLYAQERRRAEGLAAVNRVAQRISRALDLRETLDAVVGAAAELIPCSLAEISLWDAEREVLVLQAIRCAPERAFPLRKTFPPGKGYTDRVVREKRPLLVPDVEARQDVRPDLLPGERPFKAYLGLPLLAGDELIGTLVLVHDQAGAFDAEHLRPLEALAGQAAVAIRNAWLRQEALAAERLAAVGRVAASVAHDLRSPLGGILRSAEFLARPELSPATREKLSQATVSLARRLLNTTQGILDYTRGGKLPLRRSPCPLPEFLDEVLTVLEVDFSDRGIEVVRDWRYQGAVVMDADRIAQVMYNIATNARDAMPGGDTFTVATRKAGERVKLRFTDTGPGISEELRDRVFKPFFTHGNRDGAGLGLAIARRIVEEHGGKLWVKGREGEGATFVVALPV